MFYSSVLWYMYSSAVDGSLPNQLREVPLSHALRNFSYVHVSSRANRWSFVYFDSLLYNTTNNRWAWNRKVFVKTSRREVRLLPIPQGGVWVREKAGFSLRKDRYERVRMGRNRTLMNFPGFRRLGMGKNTTTSSEHILETFTTGKKIK